VSIGGRGKGEGWGHIKKSGGGGVWELVGVKNRTFRKRRGNVEGTMGSIVSAGGTAAGKMQRAC
jgi:hypothetical protein